jgi:hypothetical protein
MQEQEIGIGNEVAFAGLFVNHHGKKRNEPIVRFGTISAMPAEPVATKVGDIEAYLIESRSVGGLSGSPVFVDVGMFKGANQDGPRQYRTAGPGMYLIGVMHGHWRAPLEDVKVDDGISTEYVNMGIAVVTPIDELLSLFDESPYKRRLEAVANEEVDSDREASP